MLRDIEEYLIPALNCTVQHEINEDVYTFEDSDDCCEAMSELSNYLYEQTTDSYEITITLDFEEDCFQIRVKEL